MPRVFQAWAATENYVLSLLQLHKHAQPVLGDQSEKF
jgi:hypothetical protein